MIQSTEAPIQRSTCIQPGSRWPAPDVKNTSTQGVTVRPIQSAYELDEVYRLTYAAYLDQGYCEPNADATLNHNPHLNNIPETTILVAIIDGQIVGTNSLTFDGPQGLHVDIDFKSECDKIRAEGKPLGASWRIVTSPACRESRQVVMSLIQETVRRTIAGGVETCVFTFNPRHERIYKRLLNMTTVARTEFSNELINAPAVLMRWDLERCPKRWLSDNSRV